MEQPYVYYGGLVLALIGSGWFAYSGPLMVPEADRKNWHSRDWFNQRLLNFLGSSLGWAALAFVYHRIVTIDDLSKFGVWDAIGVLVAFLGIAGHLPLFLLQLVKWRFGG